ncbi:hypothetical protein [Clostridium chromiireducens]|uniref:DUF4276 family protein n=1 Tax=Clostridium chromiireducens TaxID=225345 RepID=A0A1V4IK59_9CLOT|nr:hypothetical protein [Clostridium chromiireducens]OPJ60418.1 hypothetical protein CLCHR_29040 [Clostridium chromiireducens]
MNLYILVEDGKSGQEIIRRWMNVLLPNLTRKRTIANVDTNSYVINSGHGYPRVIGINPDSQEKNVLGDTIDTINSYKNIDYLVLFLDGDDDGVEKRKETVEANIKRYSSERSFNYKIIVQNKCIETWLLGNNSMFPEAYSSEFESYVLNYDISEYDPEEMNKPVGHRASTNAKYHVKYLQKMFKEGGISYSKERPPTIVYGVNYINELKNRINETNHLKSMKEFFDFAEELSNKE